MSSMSNKGYLFALLLAFFGLGCSNQEPARLTLTGQIMLEDKPLADVIVQFWERGNDCEPYGSSYKSDESGGYEMKVLGFRPAAYIVRVMETRLRACRVPEIYADCETSPLIHEVRPEDPDLGVIRLSKDSSAKTPTLPTP